MRILFILFMILQTLSASSQTSQEPSPRILLIDTTLNLAPAFNNMVVKYATGYRLMGSEQEPGNRLIFAYTDGRDGSLKIEYKYERENGKQIVVYQSITADLEVIIPVFNGLFRMGLATDIDHASMIGGPIQYHNKEYQCLMQADDYRPGYWVLSFVK